MKPVSLHCAEEWVLFKHEEEDDVRVNAAVCVCERSLWVHIICGVHAVIHLCNMLHLLTVTKIDCVCACACAAGKHLHKWQQDAECQHHCLLVHCNANMSSPY